MANAVGSAGVLARSIAAPELGRLIALRPGAFRLFLALLVFAHHCSRLGLGKYAVYVFFVLSGYWVDRMWVARYRQTRWPYRTYLISRAWRLLPVFVLVGTIVTALELLMGLSTRTLLGRHPEHLVLSSLLIFGYSSLDYLPVGPAWSLDIEAQYYVLAPLLALAVRRRSMAVLLVSLVVVSTVSAWVANKPVLPSYIGFFGAGLAASALDWRPSARVAAVSAGGTAVALLALGLSPWRGALLGGAHPPPLFAFNPLLNIIAATATIPFAIFTTRQRSDARDRMMADLSYIVYLAHWPVFMWLSMTGGSAVQRLPHLAIGWVAVLVGSYVIWRWFDRPINITRAKWVASRTHEAPGRATGELAAP